MLCHYRMAIYQLFSGPLLLLLLRVNLFLNFTNVFWSGSVKYIVRYISSLWELILLHCSILSCKCYAVGKKRNACIISFIKYICIWKWPLTCIYLFSVCCISCRGVVWERGIKALTCWWSLYLWWTFVTTDVKVWWTVWSSPPTELRPSLQNIQRNQ